MWNMPSPYSAIVDHDSDQDSVVATTASTEHRDLLWWLKRLIVGALVGTCTFGWFRAIHRRRQRHHRGHPDNLSPGHTHASMGAALEPALNYTQLVHG